MAAKRKTAPRVISPLRYSDLTWHDGTTARIYPSGADVQKANAGKRYYVDAHGPKIIDPVLGEIFDGSRLQPGYRDRQSPDVFNARPGMTATDLDDLVNRLNRRETIAPSKLAKGRKPKKAELPAQWVEVLVNVPETRAKLDAARGKNLSRDELREIMLMLSPAFRLPTAMKTKLAPEPAKRNAQPQTMQAVKRERVRKEQQKRDVLAATEKTNQAEDRLIKSVAKQLERYFAVGRKDGRNADRDAKRKRL